LLDHPHVQVVAATSERFAGRYVHSVHPNLRGRTALQFSSVADLPEADVLFLCLPHGQAARRMDEFARRASIIVDCSADFRLRAPDWHARWYDAETRADEWRARFVYGLPELEAGTRATNASHHPERAGAVRSFAPVGHRHQAEIIQALNIAPETLFFSATAVEMVPT